MQLLIELPTRAEQIAFKLEAGSAEVWPCALDGGMRYFTAAGEQAASAICPEFPAVI